jgi:hypothetical protein
MTWNESHLIKNQLASRFTYFTSKMERDSMSEDGEKAIRYHLPAHFVLDAGERILIERLEAGTTSWTYQFDAPNHVRSSDSLQNYLREIALEEQGGEAWRAVSERGELLRLYSVYDLAKELSGKQAITLHPEDQHFLGRAHRRLGLAFPAM